MKRMQFIIMQKGNPIGQYTLVLNPEEYTLIEPARVNATQTSGGAWIDDFGLGIPILYFRGTTGLKNKTGNILSGLEELKKLRDEIYRLYFYRQVPGDQNEHELHFYNFTDRDYMIVVPQIFTLQRSISQPLLIRYEVRFVVRKFIESKETISDSLIDTFTKPINLSDVSNQLSQYASTLSEFTP